MELNDLTGLPPVAEAPAPVEPVAPITADTTDPAGKPVTFTDTPYAPVEYDVLHIPAPPGGVLQAAPNLEGAQAAAEAAPPANPIVLEPDAPQLFPSSEGAPIVQRAAPVVEERVEHRPPDDRGFRYAWQRNRADKRRF